MGFKPITTSQAAFLKAGFFGFQGSGKTRTASELAIWLHKHIKSTKPIGFIDTETGSDFVYPLFRHHGIGLEVDKTRAFKTLVKNVDEASALFDILITDSITHFWRELVKAYKTERKQRFLRIQDWGPLKEEWQQYTDRYVNSPLHFIMCGRASNIFEDIEDDDDDSPGDDRKKWRAVKVGTKMSAEGETGYEPSLLVEMQKVMIGEGGKYVRRAVVVKERFGVIDSKEFDFGPEDKPGYVFECFFPHIQLLNLGGEHLGVDTTQSSQEMFRSSDRSVTERRRQQKVLTEEIEGFFTSAFPGQSAQEKKYRADLAEVAFGTRSWTAICEKEPAILRDGKTVLEHLCAAIQRAHKEQEEIPTGTDFVAWLRRQRARFDMPETVANGVSEKSSLFD